MAKREPKVYTFTIKRKELFAVVAGLLITYVMVFLLGYSLGREFSSVQPVAVEGYESVQPEQSEPEEPEHIVIAKEEPSHQEPSSEVSIPVVKPPASGPSKPEKPAVEIPIKPIKQPPASAKPPSPAVRYFVQAGAFSKHSSATALKKRLEDKGYRVTIMKVGPLYKVLVGPFSSEEDAKRSKKKLIKDEKIYGYIVKL